MADEPSPYSANLVKTSRDLLSSGLDLGTGFRDPVMSVVKRWSPVGPADGEVEDARLDGPGMRLGVLLASLPAGTVTSTAIAWPDFRSSDSDASRSRRIA